MCIYLILLDLVLDLNELALLIRIVDRLQKVRMYVCM